VETNPPTRKQGTTSSRRARWNWKLSCLVLYFLVGITGWVGIELRVGPIWSDGKIVERLPLFVAVYNWLLHPERMQYVATSDLKMNHQLRRDDFTFPPKVEVLYNYFPRVDDIKGKYLKKNIAAGKSISLEDVSPLPTVDPEPDSYTVTVRLNKQAIPKGLVEAKSAVVIAPLNSTDRLQGTVLSTTWEEGPSPIKSNEPNKPPVTPTPLERVTPATEPHAPPNN
jgi:hypothetical protein